MPDFHHENALGRQNGTLIAGIDEVGRGPLAGPVVAAALIWPHDADHADLWQRIDDSKKLSAIKRDALADEIMASSAIWSIGSASVEEIDTHNILQATFIAMRRALDGLATAPAHCVIDGNRGPKNWPTPSTMIVGGDGHSLSIAAASIIAKVHRDRLMQELATAHPHYGWESNAGYGTRVHMEGLDRHGVTVHHRRSFAPIRAIIERDLAA